MSNTNSTYNTNDSRLPLSQDQADLKNQIRYVHHLRLVCSLALTCTVAATAGLGYGLATDFVEGGRASQQTSQLRRAR